MKTTLKACLVYSIVSAALLLGGWSVHAASQVWTNTPVSQYWTNTANWDGGAFPGTINATANTGNNVDNDAVTFNTPIPVSGYGGASSPILIVDSTNASRSLEIGSIIFDTANCGAYVFQTNLPCNYTFWTTPAPAGSSGSNGCLYVSMLNTANPTNGIFMNPAVNTSQTFLVPVFIRLPSSTAGIYNFVNNSANSAATLYFNAITNDSSTSRGTTFTLGGSNTGTNTIQYLSKGSTTSGAMGFIKQGTGTWIVQNVGGGDFAKQAAVSINDGTLEIVDSGCWGLATPILVNSNAVEQLFSASQTNTTLSANATVQMKGAGTLAGVAIGVSTGTTPHLATTTSGDVLTVGILGTSTTAVTGGSATSVININGPGAVLVATNSTYLGNWTVNAGSLQAGSASALGTGPTVTIAAGGTLDSTPLGAGVTYNPSTLGITASGTGTTLGTTAAAIKPDSAGIIDLATGSKNIVLNYHPTSFTGDASHPALYVSQGTLNVGGNTITVDNISGTPLQAGTYELINVASGNINNAGNLAANVTGSGLAVGDVGTIQVSGGNINLLVAAYVPKHLVWEGGNPNDNWDNTTPNWWNGSASVVFNNSDFATFNSFGISNPIVNLVGALIPGQPVLVDTTAGNYTFAGGGAIGGTASLTKMGTGTLVISNFNTYIGGTVVSNGTIQLGTNNALSGNSDVTVSNSASVDLNSWSAAIGALGGGGTVDTIAGGTPTLTVGNNGDSGTFSGTIKNTGGTLALIKGNTGTQTLSGANTYAGATTINGGTLRVANPNALGSGASAVTINSGTTLDVSSAENIASLAGSGTVANNSTSTTNQVNVKATSTFNGNIVDGSGGGGLSLLVSGGVFEFTAPSTYSGGTIVASGATLEIAGTTPGSTPGTGGIIASNGAVFAMPTATSISAAIGNTITTVNNAQVEFTSGETANSWTGLFVGSTTATNLFANANMTIGGNGNAVETFTNFLGTVLVTNGNVRSFGTLNGGNNTTFDFIDGGGWFMRDGGATFVHFGTLWSDTTANIANITNPSTTNTPAGDGNYIIGEANVDSVYSGSITGSNNIIKAGTGTLVFNYGSSIFTNTIPTFPTPTVIIGYGSNAMTYTGSTVVSNGVLALIVPTVLSNSCIITLATPSAVLDVSSMGSISNQLDSDEVTITNQIVTTNSTLELDITPAQNTPQTLNGVGTLKGNLLTDVGTLLTPGLPTGNLTVATNATLNGAVIMDLDTTNAATNSELSAASFTINSPATLTVTNIGPGLINGSTFKLFNHGVSGFGSVILPAKDPTGGTNYVWQNDLASTGTITLTSGGVAPPPLVGAKIGFTFSNGVLSLSWPSGFLGQTLQVQTNSLKVGINTNWFDVPNTASVLSTNITVNPANGTVFYRLRP